MAPIFATIPIAIGIESPQEPLIQQIARPGIWDLDVLQIISKGDCPPLAKNIKK